MTDNLIDMVLNGHVGKSDQSESFVQPINRKCELLNCVTVFPGNMSTEVKCCCTKQNWIF